MMMASSTNSIKSRSLTPKPQFSTTNSVPDSTLLDPTPPPPLSSRTVDDVWRDIVAGERRSEFKEVGPDDYLMTLEDFLVKAGAVSEDEVDDCEVKMPMPLTQRLSSGASMFGYESLYQNGVEGGGSGDVGRGKRGCSVLEQLDKAVQQRQKRMIKNRESAARSRERKQAYQVELELLAVKLEEENDKLIKEKAEKRRERYKQLMEKVIPIVEKRKPPRLLRRFHSLQW
ncbi:hypothetical protein Lal_00011585 [Lupinus albus]|uniref:Putative transcription factor bZIP family n=1 Tax=Lupinus albus TaxID=3870 RepID=A0A6A5N029_LUPAL|nr:putative transcription factor bZIP family [Lupinus albus]KAF1880526.1 hypothetical protein Lal_00011585 [Lupinus albus]